MSDRHRNKQKRTHRKKRFLTALVYKKKIKRKNCDKANYVAYKMYKFQNIWPAGHLKLLKYINYISSHYY